MNTVVFDGEREDAADGRVKWQSRLRTKPLYLHSRDELLAEIARMPDDAYVTAQHAAAYLGTHASVLANWRSNRRGPQYEGVGRFIRYRLSTLRAFMGARAGEVAP